MNETSINYEEKYKKLVDNFREMLFNALNEEEVLEKEYIISLSDEQVIDEVVNYAYEGMFPRDNGAIHYQIMSRYMSNN